jgi:hypothetical protein
MWVLFLALLTSWQLGAQDQQGSTAEIHFLGHVQSVNPERETVKVKHGPIPGHSGRGVDEYSVANDSVRKQLQPGDDISASVYSKERTLYNVRIVYRRAEDHKGGK